MRTNVDARHFVIPVAVWFWVTSENPQLAAANESWDSNSRTSGVEVDFPSMQLWSAPVLPPAFEPDLRALVDPEAKSVAVPWAGSTRFFRLSGRNPTRITRTRVTNNALLLSYEEIWTPPDMKWDAILSVGEPFQLGPPVLPPPSIPGLILGPKPAQTVMKLEPIPILEITDIQAEAEAVAPECGVHRYRIRATISNVGSATVTHQNVPHKLLTGSYSSPTWNAEARGYQDGSQPFDFSGSRPAIIGLKPGESVEAVSNYGYMQVKPFEVRVDLISWRTTEEGVREGWIVATLSRQFPGSGPDLRLVLPGYIPLGERKSGSGEVVRTGCPLFDVRNVGDAATPGDFRFAVIVPAIGGPLGSDRASGYWAFKMRQAKPGEVRRTYDPEFQSTLEQPMRGDPDWERIWLIVDPYCSYESSLSLGGSGYDADIRDNETIARKTQ